MFKHKMSSALGLSVGWGALMQDSNLQTFEDLFIKNDNVLPGISRFLNGQKNIMCLVTIPRVRPHKYLNLTKFEKLIFLIFSMINDIVQNIGKNNQEMTVSFTLDTTSKLTNLNLMIENIEVHKKAIIYACKSCVLNIKRKGVAPAYIMKMMKDLMQISINTINNPGDFYSHMSLFFNRHAEYLHETGYTVCLRLHHDGVFNLGNGNYIKKLKPNQTTTRSLTLHGTIHNDGSCQGSQYSDHYRTWDSVIVQGITLKSGYAPQLK